MNQTTIRPTAWWFLYLQIKLNLQMHSTLLAWSHLCFNPQLYVVSYVLNSYLQIHHLVVIPGYLDVQFKIIFQQECFEKHISCFLKYSNTLKYDKQMDGQKGRHTTEKWSTDAGATGTWLLYCKENINSLVHLLLMNFDENIITEVFYPDWGIAWIIVCKLHWDWSLCTTRYLHAYCWL